MSDKLNRNDGFMPSSLVDENATSYGVKHTNNEIHVRAKITDANGNIINAENVTDRLTHELLTEMLNVLKRIEYHLSIATDVYPPN